MITKPPCRPGDRIRLDEMPHDPNPIPSGSLGTVRHVSALGDEWQIDVNWDTSRTLLLIWPTDRFTVLSTN